MCENGEVNATTVGGSDHYCRRVIVVPPVELSRLRTFFAAEHLGFVVDAMAAGNTVVKVWADNLVTPTAVLLWDLQHAVYLAGSAEHAQHWRDLFDEQIAATKPGFLKLHITAAAADTVFDGYDLQPRDRVLYRATTTPELRTLPLPDGFAISSINDRFDQLRGLRNFDAVVDEIESCWPSVEGFRRSGFGFVAHNGDHIVCWCTAECVSPRTCGIGIETLPDYQGRGFATLTAQRFLQHAADQNTVAHWDAWAGNAPSIAVADKIGLTYVESYSIYTGVLDDTTTT